MTLSPGSKLGPYEILSSIGSGGMGEVWKARDTRLGRIVAIKKVKEQHSERFKQEARSIAALNHSNICQIFDIGNDYLVLEYVEGKPLSSPLPEQEAVKLAIQIATALEAAHKKGIIHRDLKPANIMVTDEGTVKLLDFGLAKLYEQDQSISNLPTEDFPATQAGAILGTVAYMSPEQAQGQPADARSDIFSFGQVLYEMLSGRRAFSGDSNFTLLEAIVRKEPPPLRASTQMEKIVKRCLEKNPEERYQTASDLCADLKQLKRSSISEVEETFSISPQPDANPTSSRIFFSKKRILTALTLSVILLVLIAAAIPPFRRAVIEMLSRKPDPGIKSIAILPLENNSENEDYDFLGDALSEELIDVLNTLPDLRAIARTSSFSFRGKDLGIREIGSALHVGYILEGSVNKAGDEIRIKARLVSVEDQYPIWSKTYERKWTDVLKIEDEICQAIANTLRIKLAAGRPLVKSYTDNIKAYELGLKARYHLNKASPEDFMQSKDYYDQALRLDPNDAKALAGLAQYYTVMGYFGFVPTKEANQLCRQYALKALEIDDQLPRAHAILGVLKAVEYDWDGAKNEFDRALAIDPESAETWTNYDFYYLVPMRRLDEAIEATENAIVVDPLWVLPHWRLGMWYLFNRQYDRAIEQAQNALEIDPDDWTAPMVLAGIYIVKEKYDLAIQALEKAEKAQGRNPYLLSIYAYTYAKMGKIDDARALLEELKETSKNTHVQSFSFATIYYGLGQYKTAFDWLEKAVDDHESDVIHIHVHPIFNSLRSHPRYKALLRKMNLDP